MINCNPETVSTDYDVAGKLYFERVTYADVVSVAGLELRGGGVMLFGGECPG